MPRKQLAARLRDVSGRLARKFGRPRRSAHRTDPLRNLVLTILSQNTTDTNRDRAFSRLTERFPTMPLLAKAPPEEVEEAIRVGGLPRAKAKAILSALARIQRERGDYTLDFLSAMPLAEARKYLTSFPGVGVKTANVLLLFSFGKEAFPVDTHILRVTRRLGLVPASADLSRAALLLEPHVPPGEQMPLHMNLIRLGRETCRPRNPSCPECPLLPICPEGRRRARIHPWRIRTEDPSSEGPPTEQGGKAAGMAASGPEAAPGARTGMSEREGARTRRAPR